MKRLCKICFYLIVRKNFRLNCKVRQSYSNIFQQIKQREHTEKVNLLLSCGQYKLWPRQPLLQVAELIEWITYPPNTGMWVSVWGLRTCSIILSVLFNSGFGLGRLTTKVTVLLRLKTILLSNLYLETNILQISLDNLPLNCMTFIILKGLRLKVLLSTRVHKYCFQKLENKMILQILWDNC